MTTNNSTIDQYSETWDAVSAWATREITASLGSLENPAVEWAQVQVIRGRIDALRRLLALPEQQQKQQGAGEIPDYV